MPATKKPKIDYKEKLAEYLAIAPKALGLNWTLQPEHRFHPVRRWRFDWIWLDEQGEPTMIAVEFDGIFGGRSHTSIPGIMRDQEKLNHAQILGWRVYRANAGSVRDGSFQAFIDNVLIERARVGG